MIKILVVCSRNKKRSLTAEKIFAKDQRVFVRSVGTSPKAKRRITESDIIWADLILCMENKHLELIRKQFEHTTFPKIIVLEIADEYEYLDPDLVRLLETGIEEALF